MQGNDRSRTGRRWLAVAVAGAIAVVSFRIGAAIDRRGPSYRIVDGDGEIAIVFESSAYPEKSPNEWLMLDARGRPLAGRRLPTPDFPQPSSSSLDSETDASGRAVFPHAVILEAAGAYIYSPDAGLILTIRKPRNR